LRWPLYALPVATVAVIALALVTGGAARPTRVARIWGGPTTGDRVSFRAEVFDLIEERAAVHEAPVSRGQIRVELHAPAFDAARTLPLDDEGGAEMAFEPPEGARPLELRLTQAGSELARGRIELAAAPWAGAARRRGGWATTHAGEFEIRVAPARGALAVPFEEELFVAVSRDGAPAQNVTVSASGTGARITPRERLTDANGRCSFQIAPEEHAVNVTFGVNDSLQASFALPVVPGAMRARKDGNELVIESPVPRDLAYFAVVTPSERWFGGRVTLTPAANGRSSARVPLPVLGTGPHYAVVSSELDLRSSAAVGWPLEPAADGEPARTFDAVEALLLDGRPRALHREGRRRTRVRWVLGAFSAAALAVELLLLVAFTRRSDRELDAHLAGAGVNLEDASRLAPKRSPAVAVALIAVALGFLVVALIGVLRVE
ncbi:MAG TPA: hypothetical protein VLJ38_19120, partial [Polyangiaceae bacterium]|nr:hypothetical protein [Polyangiaceae bacterium]